MIQPIQLLRESYGTYKKNFKKIMMMSFPVLIISYVMSYASYEVNILIDAHLYGYSLVLFFLLFIVCLLVVALFLAPAINRAVQKNEDAGSFDVKGGYDFMKSNKWKWFMTNVWGALYFLARTWFYIIPAYLLGAYVLGSYMSDPRSAIYFGIAVLLGVIALVSNIHRFLLFKTIIFSKEISARGAVRESVTLGKNHKKDMWMLILSMVLVGLAVALLSMIIGTICRAFGVSKEAVDMFVSPLVTVLITSPMLLIMTAKTYVKLRSSVV